MNESELRKIMSEELDKKFENFYIPPEDHYKQHQFLGSLIDWSQGMKKTIWKSITRTIVGGIITLILAGFACFYWKG